MRNSRVQADPIAGLRLPGLGMVLAFFAVVTGFSAEWPPPVRVHPPSSEVADDEIAVYVEHEGKPAAHVLLKVVAHGYPTESTRRSDRNGVVQIRVQPLRSYALCVIDREYEPVLLQDCVAGNRYLIDLESRPEGMKVLDLLGLSQPGPEKIDLPGISSFTFSGNSSSAGGSKQIYVTPGSLDTHVSPGTNTGNRMWFPEGEWVVVRERDQVIRLKAFAPSPWSSLWIYEPLPGEDVHEASQPGRTPFAERDSAPWPAPVGESAAKEWPPPPPERPEPMADETGKDRIRFQTLLGGKPAGSVQIELSSGGYDYHDTEYSSGEGNAEFKVDPLLAYSALLESRKYMPVQLNDCRGGGTYTVELEERPDDVRSISGVGHYEIVKLRGFSDMRVTGFGGSEGGVKSVGLSPLDEALIIQGGRQQGTTTFVEMDTWTPLAEGSRRAEFKVLASRHGHYLFLYRPLPSSD